MLTPLPKHEIGVVVALASEAAGFTAAGAEVDPPARTAGIQVSVGGIGHERATAASQRLVEQGARLLVSWGIAAGLSPALRAGDILLPRSVVADDHEWAADVTWRERLEGELASGRPALTGRLWCSKTPIASVEEKSWLANHGLAAADMESAAVAAVACNAGLPFVAVKVICDPASLGVPSAALQMIDADGQVRLRGLPAVMRAGPSAWRSMLALSADFAIARRALQRAALVLSR